MSLADQDTPSLIEQLKHKSSAKRRSAAKKLRKLKAKEAGPAVLEALKKELQDKRTWETQYQMIMALGESGNTDSLDFLQPLAKQEFEATMLYVAIGDAITRLIYLMENSSHKAIAQMLSNTENPLLSDGILRAIAMQKLFPKMRI